jgi:hypothetical protein
MSISDRISRAAGVRNLVDVLAVRLAPTDLQSLLLDVFRRRAAKLEPADVLRRYEERRFVRPSPLDPRRLLAFDEVAFATAAPTFEPVELAPVAPLGAVSALADLDQNLAVATVRNTEVVSDSTNVLALECAARRRALGSGRRNARSLNLCASHRLLRGQAYEDAALSAHFRLFALVTAGRDSGSWQFEIESVGAHVSFYLRLFARLHDGGFTSAPVRTRVGFTRLKKGPPEDLVETAVLAPMRKEFPQASFGFDRTRVDGRSYYDGLCFAVHVDVGDGATALVDGGLTDWTQRLLADRKERLMISGVGSELVCSLLAERG